MSGSQSTPNAGYNALATDYDDVDVVNAIKRVIRQEQGTRSHAMPVKVIAVHGGGNSATCTVDVQPMVNQVDGAGNNTPHGIVYGIPVHRQQSGSVAIVMDPIVGSKGMLMVSDRDISTMIATGNVSGPGSRRQNSFPDGVYVGGLDGVGEGATPPESTITITPNNIAVTTPNAMTFACKNFTIDANGNATFLGEVTAFVNGIAIQLSQHIHNLVTTGDEDSGPPVSNT